MTIRQMTPQDYGDVYYLIQQAFKTANVSDGTEQDFAVRLRKSPVYISELDLVAVVNGDIVGHVMLTKKDIECETGNIGALMLAPISVKLECRKQGIGRELIKAALIKASELGYPAVFLCGDPNYYGRFGFVSTADFGIERTGVIEQKYTLCIELKEGALKGVSGKIHLE